MVLILVAQLGRYRVSGHSSDGCFCQLGASVKDWLRPRSPPTAPVGAWPGSPRRHQPGEPCARSNGSARIARSRLTSSPGLVSFAFRRATPLLTARLPLGPAFPVGLGIGKASLANRILSRGMSLPKLHGKRSENGLMSCLCQAAASPGDVGMALTSPRAEKAGSGSPGPFTCRCSRPFRDRSESR